jgi:tetratricopeptide (TPR) repeat protein
MDKSAIECILEWICLEDKVAFQMIELKLDEEQARERCKAAVLIGKANYKAVHDDFMANIDYNSQEYRSWLQIAYTFIDILLFEQAAFILSNLELQAGLNTKSKIALGNCYGSSRNIERALEILLDIDPSLLDGLQDFEQYALLLSHCGKVKEAIEMLDKLIEKEPHQESLYNNRACIRAKYTGIESAKLNIKDIKFVLSRNPSGIIRISGISNLANEYKKLGNHRAASRLFIKCFELSRDDTYLFFNSLTTLQISQLDLGWEDYEYRLSKLSLSIFAQKVDSLWTKTKFARKFEILCIWEQGLGDTLFAINFIHILELLEVQFSLYVQPPLFRTAAHLLGDERVKSITLDHVPDLLNSLKPNQKVLPMMSLPLVTKTHFNTVKGVNTYNRIYIDQNLITLWRARLKELTLGSYALKIGLVWKGNPQAERGPLVGRSIPLSQLSSILTIKNCLFIPLQHGEALQDISEYGFQHLFPHNIEKKLAKIDILDRIAIAKCLDLVITIDTLSAHYCGVFLINTALLLHYSHDWRWGFKQNTSPIYPTVKLFRQAAPGSWDDPVNQISHYVKNMLISKP